MSVDHFAEIESSRPAALLRPMNLLTFSTLFPNAAMPRHGIFVENRLRHLVDSGEVVSRVIAPIPWFPFTSERFGEYAKFAKAPHYEKRHDLEVEHPRYVLIPKVGMTITPWMLAAAVRPVVRKLIRKGFMFDAIDAHYFFPDGVAAIMIGREFRKPVVITARGTDLNLIPQFSIPRKMIQWAARNAAGMITVCQALKDSLIELGVEAERVTVLRNGVDLNTFKPPTNRNELRTKLGIKVKTLLSVGHLIKRKGHDLVIKAMPNLCDMELLIAGDGPEEQSLRELASSLGVASRVKFLGAVRHEKLRDYYGAVDILVLASSREGWANVLLEAMACGTPVVATNVWGTPEVVATDAAGVLMQERSPKGVEDGVRLLLERPLDRISTRRYAERFSWNDTTRGQIELFRRIIARPNL